MQKVLAEVSCFKNWKSFVDLALFNTAVDLNQIVSFFFSFFLFGFFFFLSAKTMAKTAWLGLRFWKLNCNYKKIEVMDLFVSLSCIKKTEKIVFSKTEEKCHTQEKCQWKIDLW